MKKSELVAYLDSYLDIASTKDDSKNGLQIDSMREEITRIGVAVDATAYTADLAREMGVEFLFVHHGMYWGREQPLTGLHYERTSRFFMADMALYACHLPLDLHPESGNNIALLRALVVALGLDPATIHIKPFGRYHGATIGFGMEFIDSVSIERFMEAVVLVGILPELYDFGHLDVVRSFAVVTGGAGDTIVEAHSEGYDIYITGEAVHYHITAGRELGQSFILGGHYETETFGPIAIGEHLRDRFWLDVVFVDAPPSE